MKKNIFYILAITILFISCKKSDVSPQPLLTANFAKEGLNYVQIPLNKYFIYKDSVSGNTDSVIVTQSILETKLMPANILLILVFSPPMPAYYYQSYTLLLSKVNGNTSTDWFYGIANADPTINLNTLVGLTLIEGRDISTKYKIPAFKYPFYFGTSKITIEGKDYSDVIQITNSNYLSPSSPDYLTSYFTSTYYWAKGIGIVKRTLKTATSTQTWTLLRRG